MLKSKNESMPDAPSQSAFSKLGDAFSAVKDYIDLQKRFFMNALNMDYIAKNNLRLGKLHFYEGNLSDAIMRLKGAIFLKKDNVEARYYLGRCYLAKEDKENALHYFMQAIEKDKHHSKSQYYITKLQHPERIRRINMDLVKENASFVAEDFDLLQAELGYQGDVIAVNLLKNHLNDQNDQPLHHLLDIGCMGGVAARAFRKHFPVKRITGIDLSAKATKQLEKQLYEEELLYNDLKTGDAESLITQYKQQFDIVLALNMLHNFSSIDQLFRGIAQSLKNNGYFIGTFFPNKTERWKLDPVKDRFTHYFPYIKEEAKRYGLVLLEQRSVPLYTAFEDDEATFFICQRRVSLAPTVA